MASRGQGATSLSKSRSTLFVVACWLTNGRRFRGMQTSSTSTPQPSRRSTSSRVASRANPSVVPANAAATKTKGGSGPSSFASPADADLRGCWLKTCLAFAVWVVTRSSAKWSRSTTPRGRSWWVLRISEPPTSASASGSWPTPTANQYEQDLDRLQARRQRLKAERRNGNGFGLTTSQAVALSAIRDWQTPQASDMNGPGLKSGGRVCDLRTQVAQNKNWPTPTSKDECGRGYQMSEGRPFPTLPGAVGAALPHPKAWPTPHGLSGSSGPSGCELGFAVGQREMVSRNTNGKPLDSAAPRGSLNETWVIQLMGFPDGWLDEF